VLLVQVRACSPGNCQRSSATAQAPVLTTLSRSPRLHAPGHWLSGTLPAHRHEDDLRPLGVGRRRARPGHTALTCRQLRVPGARLGVASTAVQAAMAGSALQLPSAGTQALPEEAYIGISSFGFAGNNAHVVIQTADSLQLPLRLLLLQLLLLLLLVRRVEQSTQQAFQELSLLSFGDLSAGKVMEGYARSEYGNLWETHRCRPHAYGHTWSPGYELPSGMLHGHAVSTCMDYGTFLSWREGCISLEDMHRALKLISNCGLCLWHPVMAESRATGTISRRATCSAPFKCTRPSA